MIFALSEQYRSAVYLSEIEELRQVEVAAHEQLSVSGVTLG
jgi:DNA-directed RNA polymerase specialized sigma24 family protein